MPYGARASGAWESACACATSAAIGPRRWIKHPAAYGSWGTNPASFAFGSIASSSPRVIPRCSPHTTYGRSATASR
jgi:hypothetical protein